MSAIPVRQLPERPKVHMEYTKGGTDHSDPEYWRTAVRESAKTDVDGNGVVNDTKGMAGSDRVSAEQIAIADYLNEKYGGDIAAVPKEERLRATADIFGKAATQQFENNLDATAVNSVGGAAEDGVNDESNNSFDETSEILDDWEAENPNGPAGNSTDSDTQEAVDVAAPSETSDTADTADTATPTDAVNVPAPKGDYKAYAESLPIFATNPKEAYRQAVEKAFEEGVGDQDGNGTSGDHEDRVKWLVNEMGPQGAAEFVKGIIDKQVASGELTEDQRADREAAMQTEIEAASANETGYTTVDPRKSTAQTSASPTTSEEETPEADAPAGQPVSALRMPVTLSAETRADIEAGLQTDPSTDHTERLKNSLKRFGPDAVLSFQYELIEQSTEYKTEEEKEAARKKIRDEVVDIVRENDAAPDSTLMLPSTLEDQDAMDATWKAEKRNFDGDASEVSDMDKTAGLVAKYGADQTAVYLYFKWSHENDDGFTSDEGRTAARDQISKDVTAAIGYVGGGSQV
jgi:hypothetical protein